MQPRGYAGEARISAACYNFRKSKTVQMIIYVSFYSLMGFLFLMSSNTSGRQKKFFAWVLFLLIFLFAGIRGLTGSDTPAYLHFFQLASSFEGVIELLQFIEPAFVLVNVLIRGIFEDNYYFLLLYSALQTGLLYLIYIKIKNKIFILIYILIFYLNFHFNTIRAGTAALLLLYYLVEERRHLKFGAALLAPGFHVSILVFYPFFLYRFSIKQTLALMLSAAICFFFFRDYVGIFLDKGIGYADYLADFSSGPSLLSLMVIVYILFSMYFLRDNGRLYLMSGSLVITMYVISWFFPVGQRLIFMSQLFYFYFLLLGMNEKFLQQIKFIFLWPLVALMFLLNLLNIVNETEILEKRVNAGDLNSFVLESTYVPYKLYWQDQMAQSIN